MTKKIKLKLIAFILILSPTLLLAAEKKTIFQKLEKIFELISGFIWGLPLIILLGVAGIFLTLLLKGIQVRGFFKALKLIFSKKTTKEDQEGEITYFQALSTALSATVGVGNIVGVATAITNGGPGAVLWMWLIAFFGMAIKYSSSLLAVKFRKIHKDGTVSGGPMYYIEKGLGWKWLAVLFALFTALASFGIGNMAQSNTVANALVNSGLNIPVEVTGLILAILAGLVIIGGLKRIAHVASAIVPIMTILYVGGSLTFLFLNFSKIGGAFATIFNSAFGGYTGKAITGGILGFTVQQAIRYGVARGIFSNEAGLGSSAITYAAAKTKDPVKTGIVSMISPFIDTIVICTMTALVIIVSGAWQNPELKGIVLTTAAFKSTLGNTGQFIVSFGVIFFAFSTLLSWYYYADRSIEYLAGKKAISIYKWIYVIIIFVGAVIKLKFVWNFSDIFNGMMALPNLIALFALSGIIAKETKRYFSKNSF